MLYLGRCISYYFCSGMVDLLLRDTPIFVSRIYIKMLVNPRFESPQTKTKVKDKIWNTCF